MSGMMALVMVVGWGLMKSTAPTTEDVMRVRQLILRMRAFTYVHTPQKLPEMDKQMLSEIESRNQKIFQKLEENSRSSEPFWKKHK